MKNILITGASSGIGKALALEYAQNNFQVFALGRNQTRLDQLASQHKNIQSFQCDITQIADLNRVAEKLPALDILVLNAGDCRYIDDPLNFDADLFAQIINTNLIAVGYCLQAWLKLVKPKGQLAFTSSSASFLALPRAQAYGASKAGLNYLAQSLSIDLKRHIDIKLVWSPFFLLSYQTASYLLHLLFYNWCLNDSPPSNLILLNHRCVQFNF
jgi:NAD(P)-dependent dehydrogenase (short-subunit alcohol dehydrogenase family)